MTAVKLTPAQARALGISPTSAGDNATAPPEPTPAPARRKSGGERRPAPVYVCHDCGVQVVGEVGSLRHLADNHHLRYELVIERDTGGDG